MGVHCLVLEVLCRFIDGDKVMIFDGGYGTAKEARRRLEVAGLRNPRTTQGKIIFENSMGQDKVELEKLLCYMKE